MGIAALWRLAPYVAVGVEADVSRFGINGDVGAGWTQSSWLGAAVRGYFLDRGFLDPYVEAGIGRGSIDTGYDTSVLAVRVGGSGLATMVGAGLDFWISSHVKAGPQIAYVWTFLGDVHACAGPVCSATSVGSTGAASSSASIGVTIAATLGREM
jgi:hypothetical protein